MEWGVLFFFNSVMLGVGFAMDTFSVSLAYGLNEPQMKKKKMCVIAGVFAFFQALMLMIGWICVRTIARYFTAFEKFAPWIALILLVIIGGSMLMEGMKKKEKTEKAGLELTALLVQGIAASVAMSVGFTIAEYGFAMALVCALIIALVTYLICTSGLVIGKKFGTKYSSRATIFGGIILILIGVEIFISGVL